MAASSVNGQPLLHCVGKVEPESEIKPMAASDVHTFLVKPGKGWEWIGLYRDLVSEKSMIDLYLNPKVDQAWISAVNAETSLSINRMSGRFQITHSIKQIGKMVIYGGICEVKGSPPAMKF